MESQLFMFVLLCCLSWSCQYDDYNPKPNSKSVVHVGKARFTILTENMIRMEWGGSNDAPTFAFINRNLPTPKFDTSKDGNWTVIKTPSVKVIQCMHVAHTRCVPSLWYRLRGEW